LVAGAHTAGAAGVVTTCDEPNLDTALSGGGRVTFDCGSAAKITVTSTKIISADTTIDGENQDLITISGGHSVGVFSVNPGVTFTVQNLTIVDGQKNVPWPTGGGGGIYNNRGTLTVTNSTFSGNAAGNFGGAIYNTGTLTVTNSTFSANNANNGGAINNGENNGGTLTVTNSTFSANNAHGGGAIENDGPLTVSNSTFSGNSADVYGGGGIGNYFNMVTVTNCTFSGNSGSGGGGIYNTSTALTVINTIVANSTSGGNCAGPSVTDGGHNLDSDGTCGVGPATDPMLAFRLANNGGPTQTIALQAGSPAINAGDETVCTAAPVDNLDQRGYSRPGVGATSCSIGAYEYNAQQSSEPTATATDTPIPVANPTSTPTATAMPTSPVVSCIGDCDGSGAVTVNEIITLVNMALGSQTQLSACPHGLPASITAASQVDVTVIIQAVNYALNGCPAPPTSPTPIVTPNSQCSVPCGGTCSISLPCTPSGFCPHIVEVGECTSVSGNCECKPAGPPVTPVPTSPPSNFVDNSDGTITDTQTGLMWEKKSNDGSIHDLGNAYTWSSTSTAADGTAFTVFLAGLNTPPCFAGYCDWRLPTVAGSTSYPTGQAAELESILAAQYPNCTTFPCVSAVFNNNCTPGCSVANCSCTQTDYYWSSSTFAGSSNFAWYVLFGNGFAFYDHKPNFYYVRAVRGGS
jgi:hypothetical protein